MAREVFVGLIALWQFHLELGNLVLRIGYLTAQLFLSKISSPYDWGSCIFFLAM